MKYAGIIKNDIANGPGIRVSFFTQGCPHHCKGCFNPETWDPEGGKEFTPDTLEEIKTALTANGIKRNLSILGGEPFCPDNLFLTELLIREIKQTYPDITIYLWTGYKYSELSQSTNKSIQYILSTIDTLIDGPFIEEQRDITLPLCGSRNQQIIDLKKKL